MANRYSFESFASALLEKIGFNGTVLYKKGLLCSECTDPLHANSTTNSGSMGHNIIFDGTTSDSMGQQHHSLDNTDQVQWGRKIYKKI